MIAVEFSAVVSCETTVKTYDDNAFEWFLLITLAEKFLCVAQFVLIIQLLNLIFALF